MPPIARSAIKLVQRIRNPALRNQTLDLIVDASHQPDLAHFTYAACKNPAHTSHTDLTPHTTALFATEEQYMNRKVQPVHIYHDEQGRYAGHVMYAERDMKPSDD
ncbi:uncharacterized protein BJX67DRAFT_292506 [Aspergillus lucknowensis]|uniref:Uncharacterized protein n=1 Tax=Aspergillus lucknowensis TaxID=176173 RepID=A0ABR4LEB7_9EURO